MIVLATHSPRGFAALHRLGGCDPAEPTADDYDPRECRHVRQASPRTILQRASSEAPGKSTAHCTPPRFRRPEREAEPGSPSKSDGSNEYRGRHSLRTRPPL